MLDIKLYTAYLTYYIQIVLLFGAILFAAANLLLLILKLSKLFYERRVWILANIVGLGILVAYLIPPILDIHQSSFCTIDNVVKVEVIVANKIESVLITDGDGEVYTCHDYLFDAESIDDTGYPGTAVYAEHSKLLLDYKKI